MCPSRASTSGSRPASRRAWAPTTRPRTREQMAQRVTAVAKIAQRERGKKPRLGAARYLAQTNRPRREPGFGARPLALEGFLFPATYQFVAKTTSAQLVADQLEAFRRNW